MLANSKLQLMQNIANKYNKELLINSIPNHDQCRYFDNVINFNLFSVYVDDIANRASTPIFITHSNRVLTPSPRFHYSELTAIINNVSDYAYRFKIMQMMTIQTIEYLLSLEKG